MGRKSYSSFKMLSWALSRFSNPENKLRKNRAVNTDKDFITGGRKSTRQLPRGSQTQSCLHIHLTEPLQRVESRNDGEKDYTFTPSVGHGAWLPECTFLYFADEVSPLSFGLHLCFSPEMSGVMLAQNAEMHKSWLETLETSEPEIFCAPEWKYGRFIFKHLIQMADAICSDYENSSPKKFCLLALMLFQILMTFFPPKNLIPLIFPSWRNQRYFFSKTRCSYTRLTIQCRMTSLLSQRTSHVIGQFSSI